MNQRWFPITRWKATGQIVYAPFTHDTEADALTAGQERSEKWQDQTPEGAFYGTHEEFAAFVKKANGEGK